MSLHIVRRDLTPYRLASLTSLVLSVLMHSPEVRADHPGASALSGPHLHTLPSPSTLRRYIALTEFDHAEQILDLLSSGANAKSCELSPGAIQCACLTYTRDGASVSLTNILIRDGVSITIENALVEERREDTRSRFFAKKILRERGEAGASSNKTPAHVVIEDAVVEHRGDATLLDTIKLPVGPHTHPITIQDGIYWDAMFPVRGPCEPIEDDPTRGIHTYRASGATSIGEQWRILDFSGPPARDDLITGRASDRSGWLPGLASYTPDNFLLTTPHYLFAPANLSVAASASPGSWYGGKLTRFSYARDPQQNPESLELTLGTTPHDTDRALTYALVGSAHLGGRARHLSTSMERGDSRIWAHERVSSGGLSRSWRQDRLGAALHQDNLFLQVAGLQETESLDESGNLGARLDMATRTPLTRRLHLDILMRSASARALASARSTDEDASPTGFEHALLGGAALGGRTGSRQNKWLEWSAGNVLESDVSSQATGQTSAAAGSALLGARAGVEIEGRFRHITHALSPQVEVHGKPLGFEKSATAPGDEDEPLVWLLGGAHLKQSFKSKSGAFTARVPASLWTGIGSTDASVWSTGASIRQRVGETVSLSAEVFTSSALGDFSPSMMASGGLTFERWSGPISLQYNSSNMPIDLVALTSVSGRTTRLTMSESLLLRDVLAHDRALSPRDNLTHLVRARADWFVMEGFYDPEKGDAGLTGGLQFTPISEAMLGFRRGWSLGVSAGVVRLGAREEWVAQLGLSRRSD